MKKKNKIIIMGSIVILVLLFLGALYYMNMIKSTKLNREITNYANKNYIEGMTITLSDFTSFKWDKALVFYAPMSTKVISQELGVNYDRSTDLMAGIIFVKGDSIVYEEYFKRDFENPPKFIIYPHQAQEIFRYSRYRVFTKADAVFVCYQVDYKGENRYRLQPADEIAQ